MEMDGPKLCEFIPFLIFLLIVVNSCQISAADSGYGGNPSGKEEDSDGADYSNRKVYRFTFAIEEHYDNDLNDPQSWRFQQLVSRIEEPIKNIYRNAPGNYLVSVISLERNSDPSKIVVTVDVAAKGFKESDVIENLLHSPIKKQQLGDLSIADPNNIRFKEFPEGTAPFCEENEFQCDSGQCIESIKRCDKINDCNDGTDEESCFFGSPTNSEAPPKTITGTNTKATITSPTPKNTPQPVVPTLAPPKTITGTNIKATTTSPTPKNTPQPVVPTLAPPKTITGTNTKATITSPTPKNTPQPVVPTLAPPKTITGTNTKATTTSPTPKTTRQPVVTTPYRPLTTNTTHTTRVNCSTGLAISESECIRCFCFGQTTSCKSADLFVTHIDIFEPKFIWLGPSSERVAFGATLSQTGTWYLAMPENCLGNQLKSYGGYLKYSVEYWNRELPGLPDVIISGNGYILQHHSTYQPSPNTNGKIWVRFFEGEWIWKSPGIPERMATREEIMMVLEDVDSILIKLQYNEGALNTVEMDSAGYPDTGLGSASYVEECSCPAGYSGSSCERCDQGYVRGKNGKWLRQCYRERVPCTAGMYNHGRECKICPCPDGRYHCPPGYRGTSCEDCSPGFYKAHYYYERSRPLGSCLRCPCNDREKSCEAGPDQRVVCHCKPDYHGRFCESSYDDDCGVGRHIFADGKSHCQCPPGYSGLRCETAILINQREFYNNGYIECPTLKTAKSFTIKLEIKPKTAEDGILLYCGETTDGRGDFISLAVHDKQLEFRFAAGNDVTIVRHPNEVKPNQWQAVYASKTWTSVRLIIDDQLISRNLTGRFNFFKLHTSLYLGGNDQTRVRVNNGVEVHTGFEGCISNIIGVDQRIISSRNVGYCSDGSEIDNNIHRYEKELN